jgi:hypothetical protein
MPDMLYRITARHFCAGLFVAQDGCVTMAAPIIKWMSGKPIAYVRRYCTDKGWVLEPVPAHRPCARSASGL